jgi:glycosyltransferase involved in cell wall biosynthesis
VGPTQGRGLYFTQRSLSRLVSIIIPVKNEGALILNTVNSIRQAPNKTPYEIIVIDDNSTDSCCDPLQPLAAAGQLTLTKAPPNNQTPPRNLGATLARGEILVFCDAHLLVPPGWIDQLTEPLRTGIVDAICPAIAPHNAPERAGYGQTWQSDLTVRWLDHPGRLAPVPLLPGGCLAIRAAVFWQVQGFDSGFRGWGYEDQEISLNLWLQGHSLCVQPSVKILHVFRQTFPYPVQTQNVNYNLLRLACTHFNQQRLQKVIDLLTSRYGPVDDLLQQVQADGVAERRQHFLASRVYDDDWFMAQFAIPF